MRYASLHTEEFELNCERGGWAGQTFALAKCNENGGKKSRIRRSKEERKAMVESFIKKYQKSNNGKFPSLNLTHKEVGGSFYIIREVVREIIQENRVLGPAKLSEGEQSIDQFLEQNPLGSISTAAPSLLPMQSNGSPLVPSHIDDASNGSFSVSDELSMGSDFKKFDGKQINNGNLVDVVNETDKEAILEVQVIEQLESEKNSKNLAATTSKVTQITSDIVIETFPLRPAAAPTDITDGQPTEVRKLNDSLQQTENTNVIASLENVSLKSDDMNSGEVLILTNEKEVEDNEDLSSEKTSSLADRIDLESISDPLLESSDCSTSKSTMHDTLNGAVEGVVSFNDALTSEKGQAIDAEAINASNGIQPKFLGTYTSRSSGESTTQEAVVVECKVDSQHANSQKGSKKPLDRINLESWEGASKYAAQSETNPLWAIFKSFIAAFVRFWSE